MDESDKRELFAKIDKIAEDIVDIKITSVKQEVTLALQKDVLDEHIRRTSIAEERIEMIRTELEPIKNHISKIQGFKDTSIFLVKFISVLSGLIIALFKSFSFFFK